MSAPKLTLIQFSDTHIGDGDDLMHGRIDTFAALESAIETVLSSGERVHGLLFTGDLADHGTPEAYRRLREVVQPAADKLGAELVYAMGNHDDRSAFAGELLSGSDGSGPLDSVHWIDGLRVIVLDSTTPDRHDGKLEPGQLEWLRGELAIPAPRGSVLVVHHPPLPSPVPTVHLLRLHDAQRLADALTGTDVQMVLTAHSHHTGCGALAGIPVWVGPALAYRIDALPPQGRVRGRAGSGISRIDLIDGTLVVTAIEIGAAPTVYDRDRDETVRYVVDMTPQDG